MKPYLLAICALMITAAAAAPRAETVCTSFDALPLDSLPGSCDPAWHPDPAVCPTCFRPNFDFPRELPVEETVPWTDTDFTAEPEKFLLEVLTYSLEGFDPDNRRRWEVRRNAIRSWYHTPWMHPHDVDGSGLAITEDPEDAKDYGPVRTGREYLLGLTEELPSFPFYLGNGQAAERTNWAVSFVNARAAHTLWRVWGDGTGLPALGDHAVFAPGSVFAKPLYTTATPAEVPLLAGAPTAFANVSQNKFEPWNRKPTLLHLLQFDVAVKIPRERFEALTGLKDTFTWVYGTFVYDGRINSGSDPWSRLRPVGLSWGNDPQLADCAGGEPEESLVFLNTTDLGIDHRSGRAFSKPCRKTAFGRQGRLNGPVDGTISSCVSCHGAAQFRTDRDPSMTAAQSKELSRDPWPPQYSPALTEEAFWQRDQCLFENRGPNRPLGDMIEGDPTNCYVAADQYITTDTSLQLAFALNRYCKFVLYQHRRIFEKKEGANAETLKPVIVLHDASRERAHACVPSLRAEFDRMADGRRGGDGASILTFDTTDGPSFPDADSTSPDTTIGQEVERYHDIVRRAHGSVEGDLPSKGGPQR